MAAVLCSVLTVILLAMAPVGSASATSPVPVAAMLLTTSDLVHAGLGGPWRYSGAGACDLSGVASAYRAAGATAAADVCMEGAPAYADEVVGRWPAPASALGFLRRLAAGLPAQGYQPAQLVHSFPVLVVAFHDTVSFLGSPEPVDVAFAVKGTVLVEVIWSFGSGPGMPPLTKELAAALAKVGNTAQPEQLSPRVLSLSISPPALGSHGGTVVVRASLSGARTCQLLLLSKQSFPVVYARNLRPCSGVFSAHVTVGANPTPVRRVVAFELEVRNGSQVSGARFYVALGAGTR